MKCWSPKSRSVSKIRTLFSDQLIPFPVRNRVINSFFSFNCRSIFSAVRVASTSPKWDPPAFDISSLIFTTLIMIQKYSTYMRPDMMVFLIPESGLLYIMESVWIGGFSLIKLFCDSPAPNHHRIRSTLLLFYTSRKSPPLMTSPTHFSSFSFCILRSTLPSRSNTKLISVLFSSLFDSFTPLLMGGFPYALLRTFCERTVLFPFPRKPLSSLENE